MIKDTISKIKKDAIIVNDCNNEDVQKYLIQFPTESEAKFNFRRNKYISKYTNFVNASIASTIGLVLKKQPASIIHFNNFSVNLGHILTTLCLDAICFFCVDAPKLENNEQFNESVIILVNLASIDEDMLEDDAYNNVTVFAHFFTINHTKYRKVYTTTGGYVEKIDDGGQYILIHEWVHDLGF
jgi:hypothetical protein